MAEIGQTLIGPGACEERNADHVRVIRRGLTGPEPRRQRHQREHGHVRGQRQQHHLAQAIRLVRAIEEHFGDGVHVRYCLPGCLVEIAIFSTPASFNLSVTLRNCCIVTP